MQAIVRTAMEEGPLGVASALIYPPGSFADTGELVALATVAGEYDGMYISHVRGESETPIIVYPNSGEGWDAESKS